MGVALEMIGMIVSKSFGSAHRAVGSYDGRRPRWQTVAAASVAAALHVPTVVGSGYAFRAVMEVIEDGFFLVFGVFLFIPALLLVAVAISMVFFGITIGVWLLVDRPGARWYAGFFAAGGLMTASYAMYMDTAVSRLVGWSTGGLSAALLLLVLLPRIELAGAPDMASPVPSPAPEPEPEPVPSLTQPNAERRRFVL